MSKKKNRNRNRNKNKSNGQNRSVIVKSKSKKRPGLKTFAVLAALLMVSVAGIASYKQHYSSLTDLSVIGSGVPVVVQVHDPSCPSCRKLKSNTESALARIKGDLHYRIADLHTGAGRSIASKYNAQKVTLLTFAGDGEYLNSYVGIRSVESLETVFERLASDKKSK